MPDPRITQIGTAVPHQDIHQNFIDWAREQLDTPREQILFDRMAKRSGIAHRYSVLDATAEGGSPVSKGGFYAVQPLPSTGERMELYAQLAPELAINAVAQLDDRFDPAAITHLIVASCTGFVAPGIDQIIAARLGLSGSVERQLIGFMGCYAAVTALRAARHIVRSEPDAQILVITVELSTLHLQPHRSIEPLLAMLHFGDGAAAALVSAKGEGLRLKRGVSATLPGTEGLIRWDIGNQGFAMHLSGEIPAKIEAALRNPQMRALLMGKGDVDSLAIHAGGRTILDAVEAGLLLSPDQLAPSRATLAEFGNMSSSTLMFSLQTLMQTKPQSGVALAFGPGLAVEGLHFGWAD